MLGSHQQWEEAHTQSHKEDVQLGGDCRCPGWQCLLRTSAADAVTQPLQDWTCRADVDKAAPAIPPQELSEGSRVECSEVLVLYLCVLT